MRQDDRARYERALHRARASAYAPGEFVGQESFMTAAEIRALAAQAGVGPRVTVLDVCCGIAGWRWQDGMSPSPQAPVWPMAAFRDRFLSAFGSSP